jgi:hypothetical protein
MKRLLLALAFVSGFAFAEASFDQIENLIQQRNYQAAEQGLEVIIKNHPQSAKAFYAMAQAQAGLGNLEKAQKALNIATGLNPTLDFAPASSVASLKEAITPQVKKIEAVEESHFWRNFAYFALFAGFFAACYFLYSVYARKQEEEEAAEAAKLNAAAEARLAERERMRQERAEREAKEEAAEAALKAHKNYGHERFDPANPDKLKSVKQFKEEQEAAKQAAELREAQARADAAEASARMYRTSAQAVQPTHTTVVNNSGSNDMLTGVLIGNMLSGSHHDTTRVVEREVVREVPAPSRDSSWDDTPSRSSSRSSSWDDDSSSSSSKSSSWDSSSSSSSSSSWDSSSSDSSSSSSDSSW